ncbi:MAG: cytochrome P450, partial [Actinomycetota bacterium]
IAILDISNRPMNLSPSAGSTTLRNLPRGAYFPFGAGTRKCLGDQFALLEGRIIILEIARRMQLSLTSGFPVAQPRATYRPRGAVSMKVTLT